MGAPAEGLPDFNALICLVVSGRPPPLVHTEYAVALAAGAVAELRVSRQFGKIEERIHADLSTEQLWRWARENVLADFVRTRR